MAAGTDACRGASGAAGAVLWQLTALELRKTRLAVARFPLRGRSSGSNRRSGRASTSSLLPQELRVDEEAHGAFLPIVKKGSQAAQAVEEAAGLVRGRGRRRLWEKNPDSLKKSGPSREVNLGGKTGECGGVSCDFLKETPLVSSHHETFFGAKLVKRGKADSPVNVRPKITPSLRSYFKILPLVASEVSVEMAVGDKSGGKKDQCSVPAVDLNLQEDQTGEPSTVPMGNDNHALAFLQTLRVEDGGGTARLSPMEEMITKLAGEIKKGFSASKVNQAGIKEMCKILENKFDLLAKRTQLLEESMESLQEDVAQIKQDSLKSKACEQDLRDKLERMENAARRNNLRILNIPEGEEGNDIKAYCASLIKNSLQLEKTEQEIVADIQRIHRDPFRRDPARKKPQKILINFLTYALKEKILSQALKQKTLRGNGFPFEVRSDLASTALNSHGNWVIVLRI
ncbi:hypothetical protein NDU88_004871 [Pleurodeles waltl]|uniref:L1 transposable element RRM domain-containing protein n=1 Tax=Pleurodeles waltl TaxID=8319 RepID=A0AAV7T913_PLEWA|nr:hypothetical protein NDU88_004871 [Pleurodeles waltl]